MKTRYKLEAKKNMMIERKTVSEVCQRQGVGAVCVEVRLNGMQQTEELQRH